MKIRRVDPLRVPGLSRRAPLKFGSGLNVIYGPNGSGKTTIARLIHDDLFAEGHRLRGEASFSWELDSAPRIFIVSQGPRVGGEKSRELHARRPSADHAACYFIRSADLLGAKAENDAVIARHLRRAMSGGFDLIGLERQFAPTLPRREPRALAAAERALKACEDAQSQLAVRESRLLELEARAASAVAARSRLADLERRARILELEASRSLLADEIAGFPTVVQRVPPAAAARRDELREQTQRAGRDHEAVSRMIARIDREVQTIGPGRRLLAPRMVDRLSALRRELPRLRHDLNEAEKRLHELETAPGDQDRPTPPTCPEPGSEEISKLAAVIERAARARQAAEAVEAERRLIRARIGDRELPASRLDAREDPGDLEAALTAVDRWLALAEILEAERSRSRFRLGAGLALMLMGGAILAGLPGQAAAPVIAGLCFGLGLASSISVFVAAGRREERLAPVREDFRAAGTRPEVENWERATVARHRELLRRRLAEASFQELRAGREGDLKVELRERRRQADETRAELDAWARSLGIELDAELPMATVAQIEELRDLRRAARERRRAEKARDAAEDAIDACWEKAMEIAQFFGSELGEDTTSLDDSLRRICDDHVALSRALADRSDREAELANAERARTEALRREKEFHDRLEIAVGDDLAFQELLRLHDRWLARRDELDRIDAVISEELSLLGSAGDLAVLDAQAIAQEQRAAEELAQQQEELRDEIARIRADVSRGRESNDLASAMATRDRLRAELEARREAAIEVTIQRWLVAAIRHDESNLVRPQVLLRARELFSAFTREKFRLEIGDDDENLSARRVADGALLSLSQLSDGTRVQLLMAARLAFMAVVEADEKPPLLLDEILSTSDPERFAAIAEVLFQEVERGRQVIYCTADPHDLSRLQAQAAERAEISLALIELGDEAGPDGEAQA